MDWMTAGANLGQMITGLSVFSAAGIWIRNQVRSWQERRDAARYRNWHGYIEIGGINTWRVRLIEEPAEPSARVVLEVVDDRGKPDTNWAHNLRQHVIGDGMLARIPSEQEYDFLKALHKKNGYGNGTVVR